MPALRVSPPQLATQLLMAAGGVPTRVAAYAGDVVSGRRFPVSKESLTAVRSAGARADKHRRELDKAYEMLLDALGFEPATIDSLVARTELNSEAIASMLLILELQGRAAALPGGRYGRTP